ncbi:MAG: carbohydrate ABC transporter permease [Bacteroidota bacterium]
MMPRSRRVALAVCFYTAISLVALAMVVPFLWMISTSLKRFEAIYILPIQWIPREISFQSYIDVLTIDTIAPFYRAFLNSLFVSLLTVFVTLGSSSAAAFAFAKFDFRHRDRLFLLFIATMMVPGAVTLIPNYLVLRQINLLGTFTGLALPSIYNIWAIFLIRQNIMSLPDAYFEAAVVDGGSTFTIYRRIVLPMSKTVLASLGVITFMGTWNDYLWPLVVLTGNPNKMTISLALNNINGRWGDHYEMLMAGSLISTIPIVLLYIVAQKYFESGLTVGGLKG